MFFKKRTTHKFPLVVFGLVALGIIISSVVLIVKLFQEKEFIEVRESNNITNQSNSLKSGYFFTIEKLINEIGQKNNVDEVINSTKSVFLSVHVPAEMRDIHLSTFLEIVKMEDAKNNFTVDEVKTKVINLLQSILGFKM